MGAHPPESSYEMSQQHDNSSDMVPSKGSSVNPHIPAFISQKPWYLPQDSSAYDLTHQNLAAPPTYTDIHKPTGRWSITTKASRDRRFRKGACTNCGAMGHSKQECTERPRKRTARYLDKTLAPDDPQDPFSLNSYDGKRDRWNGYEATVQYGSTIRRYENMHTPDAALLRQDSNPDSDDSDFEANAGIDLSNDKLIEKRDARNVRTREHTAKYLVDLDPDSAYYDPKSRSMRDCLPVFGQTSESVLFSDPFTHNSTEPPASMGSQKLAWEEQPDKPEPPHGNSTSFTAKLPEPMYPKSPGPQSTLLEKYSSAVDSESGQLLTKEQLLQSDIYSEYTQDGLLLSVSNVISPSTRYREDIHDGNHREIWGSYYFMQAWGYSCCHQTTRYVYCTGESGKRSGFSA